eukprot:3008853-Rhodomonas_salina.7
MVLSGREAREPEKKLNNVPVSCPICLCASCTMGSYIVRAARTSWQRFIRSSKHSFPVMYHMSWLHTAWGHGVFGVCWRESNWSGPRMPPSVCRSLSSSAAFRLLSSPHRSGSRTTLACPRRNSRRSCGFGCHSPLYIRRFRCACLGVTYSCAADRA